MVGEDKQGLRPNEGGKQEQENKEEFHLF
jgi:hypothetical protein